MVYADGSRAMLVQDEDGNIFVPTDSQFVVRDEEVPEQVVYYMNGEGGVQLLRCGDEEDALQQFQVESAETETEIGSDG